MVRGSFAKDVVNRELAPEQIVEIALWGKRTVKRIAEQKSVWWPDPVIQEIVSLCRQMCKRG